jgi:hypothetical protein
MKDKTAGDKDTGGKDSGVQGEGDYKSARTYKHDIDDFIAKKDKDIPKMAKDAEKAVEGPENAELKKAEDIGKSKARR